MMRVRGILKAMAAFLIPVAGLLLLIFVFINLPLSHRFVAQKVNIILKSSHIPVHINSVNKVLPWSVYVQGVLISDSQGDTIAYGENIRSGLKAISLIRKKLILRDVHLDKARIELVRGIRDEKLNIVEAFASKADAKTDEQKDKKNPFEISLEDAEITDLSFRMTDSVEGIYISQNINRIKVETKKMSIAEKTILIRSVGIEGVTGSMTLNQSKADVKSESGFPWNVGLGELKAENINFVFDNPADKLKLDLLAGEIVIKARATDINKKIVDLDRVSVSRTDVVVRMDTKVKDPVKKETTSPGYFDWDIHGDMIAIQDVACRLANYSDTAGYNPLSAYSVIGLGMLISDLKINKTDINAVIKHSRFDLGNGFSLKEMDGDLSSQSGESQINLRIETSNSRLKLESRADRNIFDIAADPSSIRKANLNVSKTDISLADIYCFRPELMNIPGAKSLSAQTITINADIKLDNNVITIPVFSVSQARNIVFLIKGEIHNIFVPRNIISDLDFRIDEISNSWLKDVMNEVQPLISIPDYETMSIDGNFSDSLLSPKITLKLASDLGNIEMDGSFDFGHENFLLKTRADNLMLGKVMNNLSLGSFSGSADINGHGFKGKSMNAGAVLNIDSVLFNDYEYKLAKLECDIKPGLYDLRFHINDPSLKADMKAIVNSEGSRLSATASGNIFADLYNLHLYSDSLTVKSSVSVDLSTHQDENDARLLLSDTRIEAQYDSVTIHNVNASLKSDSLDTDLLAEADFFTLSAHMDRSVKGLRQFIQNYREYVGSLVDPAYADSIRHISDLPSINGKVKIDFNDAFLIFVPDSILSFKDLSFSFKTNTADRSIRYDILGTALRFKVFETERLKASLIDSSAVIDILVNADTCLISSQPANNIHLTSHFADWLSLTEFSILDKQARLLYNVEISSELDSNNLILKIPSGQLTLNSTKWLMDSPDLLTMDLKTKTFSPLFRIHSENSAIFIDKDFKNEWQTYNLELNNVKLSSLFRPEILSGKPGFSLSGSLDYGINKTIGNRLTADLQLTDVTWSDLSYKKIYLTSSLQSDTTGKFDFEITSRFDTSEIKITVKQPDKSGRIINAQFKQIPVNTIQPFVKKYLSDLKGNVSGDFDITSKDGTNNFTGDLSIYGVNIRINTLNASYRLPEDKIKFTGKKMVFSNFKVLDSLNNELRVDGFVDFSKKREIFANLDISSANLQIMNRKEDKNATFYGNIFIDSKLSVKGLVTSPSLSGKISLARGTDIYFRQTENLDLSESGSVLTFVSKNSSDGLIDQKAESAIPLYSKSSVESVVAIDPSTRINIEISKKMFDINMAIKGGGVLNYNMPVNGRVNMNGKYEISEGGANLKMVGWPNKAFILRKGGSIRWDGKLDDPDLNLEAINRVKSSYINPVDNKERYVDFDVTLKITSRLSDMDVLFTINTPDQYLMSIINTMSPEEQMRQAITILLFEYIDLPGISTSSNYVSEQVNQMVAAQLNSLTKTSIKGIDISFGIDTYTQGTSTGGQQTKTSLSYEVKKNLLNDRAKVEFSGIVSDAGSQNNSNTSLNNFSFEYRIDSAATKFLKVYNEHTYEDVFEGEVIKTGIGFSYRKSYPSLGDIWRKEEKIRKQNTPDK